MDGEEGNMKVYSDSEAQNHLNALLCEAPSAGAVGIQSWYTDEHKKCIYRVRG